MLKIYDYATIITLPEYDDAYRRLESFLGDLRTLSGYNYTVDGSGFVSRGSLITSKPKGASLIYALIQGANLTTAYMTGSENQTQKDGANAKIWYAPSQVVSIWTQTGSGASIIKGTTTARTNLGHEFVHAHRILNNAFMAEGSDLTGLGTYQRSGQTLGSENFGTVKTLFEEANTIGLGKTKYTNVMLTGADVPLPGVVYSITENDLRGEQGLPYRITYKFAPTSPDQ